MTGEERSAASWRDPAGFVFQRAGKFYRFVAPAYYPQLEKYVSGGLHDQLVAAKLVLPFEICGEKLPRGYSEGKILCPAQLATISFPYEWTFHMWKDAAKTTLQIAIAALTKGMVLKDATPFNIQFHEGRPVHIDSLSFEIYKEGAPWVAYRQFCESFLAPLLLMHYTHRDTGKIILSFPDGIPMSLLRRLLPSRTKWRLQVFLHVWLRAGSGSKATDHKISITKQKSLLLLKSLQDLITGLRPQRAASVWKSYYRETILSEDYLAAKDQLFLQFLHEISFDTVTDLGANDGRFSKLLATKAKFVTAADFDEQALDALYLNLRKSGVENILPVVADLSFPSPAIGWNNEERSALTERLQADLVLALALVHHLAISRNWPLALIASYFAKLSKKYLLIEFVPKSDEKYLQLIAHREDIFDAYGRSQFEAAFSGQFNILKAAAIPQSDRVLYLMQRK